MAEVTAAIITSSTAVCLSIIPCIIKYPKKSKYSIQKSMEAINKQKLNSVKENQFLSLIIEDIGEYVKKGFTNTKSFAEYVENKPQNLQTMNLIEKLSTKIQEFIRKTKKHKKKNAELIGYCYEVLLDNIIYQIQYEIADHDLIYKYGNCIMENVMNIEHIKLVNESIIKTGLCINIHIIRNIKKQDTVQNLVIWSSSNEVLKHGESIENQIQNAKNDALIQLSIMNRWDTNEHSLETVNLIINMQNLCVFLIQTLDNKKQINVISSVVNKDTEMYQNNCKLLVHELYKNEHNFLMKVNSDSLIIEHVIFYNNHVSETASYITAGILNKNIHDVVNSDNLSSLYQSKILSKRLVDVIIKDMHFDLFSIAVGSYIFVLCYMKYIK